MSRLEYMREYRSRRSNRLAAERLDVLEDELPRGTCHVTGCDREGRYEWAGAFGVRRLCSRHRPLYRKHDLILRRIRNLPERDVR
jgi:hypothetical protein